MKILNGTLLALIMLIGTACQQMVNVDKEKEAIMAVLEEESEATLANDIDRVFALHMQDELETRLELGEFGYNTYKGWEEVGALLGDALSGEGVMTGENAVNRKENVITKVMGKTAWLTCDNIWEWDEHGSKSGYNNIQVVFFEKIKGEWKISFAAYYSKPRP